MMTDVEWDVIRELQETQQRFDAALAFATNKTWNKGEFTTLHVDEAATGAFVGAKDRLSPTFST